LNATERTAFDALIGACDPKHFRKSDLPLLISLVQATLLAHELGRDSDKVVEWEKATRVQMALATRLRLTPQARSDPKTIARMQKHSHSPPPWIREPEREDDDEPDFQ